MGAKHRVRFGVYTFAGSINCQLSEKTGFNEEDALKIKDAIQTLFENDLSSARPEGSMAIERLYWWTHDCESGQYPSIKVHNQVQVRLKDDIEIPKGLEDYDITYNPLSGLKADIYQL
jgi:CRISPR-associated protein Csd2